MDGPALQRLLDRYPALLADAERHRQLGWYPAGGEVQKLAFRPTFDAVDRFADYLFGGIGFDSRDFAVHPKDFGVDSFGRRRPAVPDEALKRHKDQFDEQARSELRKLKEQCPQRLDDWISLINDVYDFGGIRMSLSVERRWIYTSYHALRVGRRAILVSELMRGRPVRTVAEIGGGHGRTTRDLVWTLGAETAFYVDLPLNMLLAARFLGHFFPDRVNLVWAEGEVPAAGRINIVAPWLIDRIAVPVDLLVNFLSFQHMTLDALRFYGERLIEPRVAALYQQNRDRPREGFDRGLDDYPFRTPFTVADRRDVFTATDASGVPRAAIVGELLVR